ncbi:MAG: FtsH protease activity modulator HflK [Chloroflexi bacterium]|nr:FtsH protease activity modulator HflK [Chloroflexota bacterium]MDA1219750.1 FtsH protease activity modulator HflK [Chloroflexota bacterium]PKB57185.1 MAG: HflK protein [SAR202 cluster bacterium Casp-Chloro-G3]
MYPPGGPRQPEMDFDQILNQLRGAMAKITARFGGGGIGLLVFGAIGIIAVIWLATGIYTVGPGQAASLRLFGAVQGAPVDQEGLKWWWPGPIGQKDVVLITETRRMELGFRGSIGGGAVPFPDEALMISGDLNIVDVQVVVQYTIKDLNDFLFRVDDPGDADRAIPAGRPDGRTLKDAAEASLRLVVGQRSIDDILVRNREEVETQTRERLQEIMDAYNSGLNIETIQLQDVKAPEEVRDAFDDVLRARQERDTRINQARAFEADIIPRAEGDSERIKEGAEAFRQSRIAQAQGEADRFTSVLNEYQNSKEVTRQRLYLEAMEEILPGITKIVVAPDAQTVLILGGDGQLTPVPLGPNP